MLKALGYITNRELWVEREGSEVREVRDISYIEGSFIYIYIEEKKENQGW